MVCRDEFVLDGAFMEHMGVVVWALVVFDSGSEPSSIMLIWGAVVKTEVVEEFFGSVEEGSKDVISEGFWGGVATGLAELFAE